MVFCSAGWSLSNDTPWEVFRSVCMVPFLGLLSRGNHKTAPSPLSHVTIPSSQHCKYLNIAVLSLVDTDHIQDFLHVPVSHPLSVASTDKRDHPARLQLRQQCSSAEGRRPPPLGPGPDGGAACQSEEQRAEEQIPTAAGTSRQDPHAAVTAWWLKLRNLCRAAFHISRTHAQRHCPIPSSRRSSGL